MRHFDIQWLKAGVAKAMHQTAAKGTFNHAREAINHPSNMTYLEDCRAWHLATGTRLIFTRDIGLPDPGFEQCLHLSLSFLDPESATARPLPHRHDLATEWIETFFPDHAALVMTEPPHGPEGKRNDVWHYRLFYSESWLQPVAVPLDDPMDFVSRRWTTWSDRAAILADTQPPPP